LRTCWGTHCKLGEHVGSPLGISWEHIGNKKKSNTHPPPREKETWAPWVHIVSTH